MVDEGFGRDVGSSLDPIVLVNRNFDTVGYFFMMQPQKKKIGFSYAIISVRHAFRL